MEFLEAETSKSAVKELENRMYELSDNQDYEEASRVRDRINDLKRVIMNMELTAPEVNLKNFIVKCKDGNPENGFELFFIAGGKLIKNINLEINEHTDSEYEMEKISELVDNIYFRGNLFGSVYFNNPGKYTKEELDSMKIISNWVCLNNSPNTLLKINSKISPSKVLEFVTSN